MSSSKNCSKCNIEKPLEQFHKDKSHDDGYKSSCKECRLKCEKSLRIKNKDNIAESKKRYYKENKENPNKRLCWILRKRIGHIVCGEQKGGSAVSDLGCSPDELVLYIQSKFYPNKQTNEEMTWDNYGRYGWHIDHIIPLSSFDLTNREQFLKACHYTNLQPMWAEENLSKGDK